MATKPRQVSCGLDLCSVPKLRDELERAVDAGYEFICASIFHPRFRRELLEGKCMERSGPVTRPDMVLASIDWIELVVGKLSPYIQVDSPDPIQRRQWEETLVQELTYCSHLHLPAVLLALRNGNNVNLARIIHDKLQHGCSYQIWIHLNMKNPAAEAMKYYADSEECENQNQEQDTWDWWNHFRSVCNFEKKLGLALEISRDIPSEKEIARWIGEPIKCIVLHTTIFRTNKKGYPVLSQAHQRLIKSLATLKVQVVIRGALRHGHIRFYYQYVDHLWKTMFQSDPPPIPAQEIEFCLQYALDPLTDHLDSQTYEEFEKDHVKYREYERAIYTALLDRVKKEEKDTKVQIVMVMGAGRGPLVRASLCAAQKADRQIKVYAVEKNPIAVNTLQAQQEENIWGSPVIVVSCDMRDWTPTEKADILVSELLSSFGDNELSPECLDGAQNVLKEDGIIIPCSYTSYLCPVESSTLYNAVRSYRESNKYPLYHFENPYMVQQRNKFQLAPTQPVFTFHHPNKNEVIDNRRYKRLTFQINQNSVLHGFYGYFDTILYQNIKLSILPETHSEGLFSWFPIFFPVREPVQLKAGCELEVHFWRLCNERSVWYEWVVTKPVVGPIHNPHGRSYAVGL